MRRSLSELKVDLAELLSERRFHAKITLGALAVGSADAIAAVLHPTPPEAIIGAVAFLFTAIGATVTAAETFEARTLRQQIEEATPRMSWPAGGQVNQH